MITELNLPWKDGHTCLSFGLKTVLVLRCKNIPKLFEDTGSLIDTGREVDLGVGSWKLNVLLSDYRTLIIANKLIENMT